jgi:hypothetical protein
VNKHLSPANFTIKTMPGLIDKVGVLWQGVLGPDLGESDMTV